MSSSAFSSELHPGRAHGGGDHASGLERIAAVYDVGENSIVVVTNDRREIRITAWRDRSTGRYVVQYERLSVITSGGQQLRVWAQTPVYERCASDDLGACLEAAVLEVDRVKVY
jgi:hypothetical protein